MSETCKTNTEPAPLKERLKTWSFWKPLVFIAVGGLGGYLYYFYVGCSSGTCAITGSPFGSIAFGGFLGYFMVSRPCAC